MASGDGDLSLTEWIKINIYFVYKHFDFRIMVKDHLDPWNIHPYGSMIILSNKIMDHKSDIKNKLEI